MTVLRLVPRESEHTAADALAAAAEGGLAHAVILGVDGDGDLTVYASGGLSQERALWLVEAFKHALFTGGIE